MIPALVLAASLLTVAPQPDTGGEPLPPGAPTDDYRLAAWCYGALKEYLDIYERVKPDLVDIDHMFGSPVQEAEPYQSDMAAYRTELKMIGAAVTLAEQASPRAIGPEGAAAVRQGMAIWSLAEMKTHRELARAWLLWSLPDRCDSDSRQLAAKSALLGKALSYNNGPAHKDGGDSDAAAPVPEAPAPPAPEAPTHAFALPSPSALDALAPQPSAFPSAPLPSTPPPRAVAPAALRPAPPPRPEPAPAQAAAPEAIATPRFTPEAEAAPQAEAAPSPGSEVVTTSPASAPRPETPTSAPPPESPSISPAPAPTPASAGPAADQPMEPQL